MSDSVRPHRRQPTRLPVPGILQARTLEWVATSFSNAWKWKVKVKSLSRVWLLVTPWTAAYQAPPSMGFSRQEYWSGVPLPSPAGKHSLMEISPNQQVYIYVFFWTERTFSPSQDRRRNSIWTFKSFASVTKEVNGGTRNRSQIYQITFQTLKA